jgi:hypothetical protein
LTELDPTDPLKGVLKIVADKDSLKVVKEDATNGFQVRQIWDES